MFIVSTYINMTNARSMFSSSSIYVLLGSIMILLRTIGLFANVVLLNFAWISHRDFPGGPLGYVAANTSVWWQVLGNVAAQVTFFIADGILVSPPSGKVRQLSHIGIPRSIVVMLSGIQGGKSLFSLC
jgi:hypothetical protein